jgi:hypothetical protein
VQIDEKPGEKYVTYPEFAQRVSSRVKLPVQRYGVITYPEGFPIEYYSGDPMLKKDRQFKKDVGQYGLCVDDMPVLKRQKVKSTPSKFSAKEQTRPLEEECGVAGVSPVKGKAGLPSVRRPVSATVSSSPIAPWLARWRSVWERACRVDAVSSYYEGTVVVLR